MDELIKLLTIFRELEIFNVTSTNDKQMPGYYLFKLFPFKAGAEFDKKLHDQICQHMPADLSCNKSKLAIKFSACPGDQDKLVDAFAKILRKQMNDDIYFYYLLGSYKPEQPFTRILNECLKEDERRAATEKQAVTQVLQHLAPAVPAVVPIQQVPAPVIVAEAKIQETLPLLAHKEPEEPVQEVQALFFWSNTKGTVIGQPPSPTPQDRLNMRLQHDLVNIVRLMDTSTTPPKIRHFLDFYGGLSNLAQKTKNYLNPIMGDADAAINIKEKLRLYSKLVDRHYNSEELEDIMQLVTSRLLHVQQNHLKDSHVEEITFLTSAEKRTRELRENLKQRETIQSTGYDAPSFLASLGYRS